MGVKVIKVTKNPLPQPMLRLVQGDANTQVIRFTVKKDYGGKDLTDLIWSVWVQGYCGEAEVSYIGTGVIDGDDIVLDWEVIPAATQSSGITTLRLYGSNAGADEKEYAWVSGNMQIMVTRSQYDPCYDEEEIGQVRQLIVDFGEKVKESAEYVDGKLSEQNEYVAGKLAEQNEYVAEKIEEQNEHVKRRLSEQEDSVDGKLLEKTAYFDGVSAKIAYDQNALLERMDEYMTLPEGTSADQAIINDLRTEIRKVSDTSYADDLKLKEEIDSVSEKINLFKLDNYSQWGMTINEVDGNIVLNGVQSGTYDIPITTLSAGTYTATYEIIGGEMTVANASGVSLRDSNNRFVNYSVTKQTNTYSTDMPIYLRINNGATCTDYTLRIKIYKGDQVLPYGFNSTAVDRIAREKLDNIVVDRKLKIACVGDSITEGIVETDTLIEEGYPYWISKIIDADVLNFGIRGLSATTYYDRAIVRKLYDYISFDESIDVVTIMFGTNGGIGVSADDDTSFIPEELTLSYLNGWKQTYPNSDYYPNTSHTHAANLCRLIEHIQYETNNHAQIILCTPPYNEYTSSNQKTVINSEATIRKIAAMYRLPVIDMLNEFGVNFTNSGVYHSSDGVHFTPNSYKMMGSFFAHKIKSIAR